MKTALTLVVATVALMLAGCSKSENEEPETRSTEIRLSSGLQVQKTRANNGDVPDKQIAENELIGAYIKGVIGESAFNGYTNVSAKADGSGNFNDYGTDMYYPESGKGVIVSAYHPYNDGTSDPYDFTVKTTQDNATDYFASDLLYSKETTFSRSDNPLSLSFVHKLVKVTCTLVSGTGSPDVAGATVEIVTPECSTKFNRITGELATPATSSKSNDVKLGTYGAVIVPQTYTKGEKFLKVTLADGGILYYTLPAGSGDSDLQLESGYVYNYTITVNLSGLTATSTIETWTPVAMTGTAVMG